MNKYLDKTVVVPWDFSEMSESALKATLEMVEDPGKIEVVHVTAYPATMEPGVVWGSITDDTISKNLEDAFAKFADESGVDGWKFTTLFGDPGTRITEFAAQQDAGLIVISSHGRTGLSRVMLGSVAERVVRLSPCPVLVLPSKDKS